ncbi:hypothetical protein ACP4OV_021731 [Aristida adscensionis]
MANDDCTNRSVVLNPRLNVERFHNPPPLAVPRTKAGATGEGIT